MIEIIYKCSIRTREIVTSKKEEIEKLAEMLLKEETVDQRMIQGVLGERPFKSSQQYEDYIREKKKMEEEDGQRAKEVDGGGAAFKALGSGQTMELGRKSRKVEIVESS